MDGSKLRIALVDDHPLFLRGLATLLRDHPDLDVAGEAENAEQAREIMKRCVIDLAILDIVMPGVSGIRLAHELRSMTAAVSILALSMIDEPFIIAEMLRSGANGYALKSQPLEEIVHAIRQVAAGRRYLPPRVSHDAIDAELELARPHQPLYQLTRREREIFEMLIRGHVTQDIARLLFISSRTVETHRQRIMKKLSARSVFELQRVAARYSAGTL